MCVPPSPQSVVEDQPLRPLSRAQGEAVVQAAWELRKGMNPRPDCSHFVHAAYERVGLDYEYANSMAIFEGIDAFQRVSKPQAGDLIVWPGHVGIIIDPDEHSFYSSVVKGFAIEDYRSRYWARRGHPRFYRYLIDEAHMAPLQTQTEVARNASKPVRKPVPAPQVISDQPIIHDKADFSEEAGAAESDVTDSKPASDYSAVDAEVLDTVFVSTRSHPLKSEVRALLVTIAEANGERALRYRPLDTMAVEIADNLTVDEINVKGNSGWIMVSMATTGTIRNGRTEMHGQSIRWRVELRHEPQGWIMLVPQDKSLVSWDQAIEALTARVAHLSHDHQHQPELKRSLHMLDDLRAGQTQYVHVAAPD